MNKSLAAFIYFVGGFWGFSIMALVVANSGGMNITIFLSFMAVVSYILAGVIYMQDGVD